jgi:cytochrome c oxidase cbb3-type subunit 2
MANENEQEWVPALEPVPADWKEHPRKRMLMTPWLILIGGVFAFAVPTLVAAFFQVFFFHPPVSDNWSPLQADAIRGRQIYLANGCIYCHSGYTRPQDVRAGLYYLYPRESLPGDFATSDSAPNTFGSARIGPDLSQEGGQHPDDWHYAHFSDPRFVTPISIMPRFSFLSDQDAKDLTAFVQQRSNKSGLVKYAGELFMKKLLKVAQGLPDPPSFSQGQSLTLADVADLQVMGVAPKDAPNLTPENDSSATVAGLGMPDPINLFVVDRGYWLTDNPLPVTKANLARGREIFQQRCIGCHGQGGSAVSLAARFMQPMPLPFSVFDDQANGNDTSPGDFYYRILRGIPGTAMENFGTRLRVDDVWRVVLFLKTIPNGGLDISTVPTPDMYVQWKPNSDLMSFVASFPIDAQLGYVSKPTNDPFKLEAERVLNGLSEGDSFDLPGFGTISLDTVASGIKDIYQQMLDQGWTDFEQRGGFPIPPASQKDALPTLDLELR